MLPSTLNSIPSRVVEDRKENESTIDSTSSGDIPTFPLSIPKPPSPFPNRLKRKTAQSHVDKIGKIFS